MIHKKYAQILFGFILSGLMSLMVSGIATFRVLGLGPDFPASWFWSWLPSWCVAFPAVLIVAPLTRKIVVRLTAD
ncbi:MAG: DUF2798 domain-containing protein [Gemmobacter sp.]|nr:DUF2798 domain-containing protein [Gemmobacter sp.]